MKLKVLHVINSLSIGGAEMLLVNSLAPDGINDHADNFLVYFKGGDHLPTKVDKAVTQICLNYQGGKDILRILNELRRIIVENKIDIIHTHLTPASFYVNIARPKEVPQVHTVHIAYSTDRETRPFLRFLEKTLFFRKKYCNLVFLSEFTKSDFLQTEKFKGRAFVLPNFADDCYFQYQPKNFTGSAGDGLKLIAIGNFRAQKNYPYLFEIFKKLKNVNIQVDIYGGGDLEKYRQVIRKEGLKICLKGQVSNIAEFIAGYDLFIMPSTNEGFPLSVFEAMAAGVPLLLSDIPPLKSIVHDNAIYFKLDDPQSVADKLVNILENRIDITAMAITAKNFAERTVRRKIYMSNLLKIYNQILH